MSETAEVRSFAGWDRAPRDGSLINVELPGGEVALVRWDDNRRLSQVPCRDGSSVPIEDDLPRDWWPVI
jgi:hypothetical protein